MNIVYLLTLSLTFLITIESFGCNITEAERDRQARLRALRLNGLRMDAAREAERVTTYESFNWVSNPVQRQKYRRIYEVKAEPTPKGVAEVIQFLSDEYRGVRAEAAQILGQIREHSAVRPLLTAVKDPEWDVSYNASISLGRIGDRSVIPALLEQLNAPDTGAKMKTHGALEGLRLLAAVEALPSFVRLMNDGNSLGLFATKALANLGTAAIPPLLLAVTHSTDSMVQESAIHSLSVLRPVMQMPRRTEVVNQIIARLNNQEQPMRVESSGIFLDVASFRTRSALAYLKAQFNRPFWQRTIVQAFGVCGLADEEAIAMIRRFREHSPFCEHDAQAVEEMADEALRILF